MEMMAGRVVRAAAALAALAALAGVGPVRTGQMATLKFPSPSLSAEPAVTVYRPDGAPPAAGWPVLYLLHGLGGDATSWPNLGGIEATLDDMIGSGAIAPLVVVMPDAGNSWYVDSAAIGGPGDYETALMSDLHRWVEHTLEVRTDAGGRAVAGLSMGGYGALRLALAYPDRFASVASLSGAMWQNVPEDDFDLAPDRLKLIAESDYFHRIDPATVVAGRDLPPPGAHFSAAFGSPFDARFFNDQNVFTLLERRVAEGADLPAMFVSVGDHDSHTLWRGAVALLETLRADDRDAALRITDGDHVWSLWRRSIVDALAFVDAQFTEPPDQ